MNRKLRTLVASLAALAALAAYWTIGTGVGSADLSVGQEVSAAQARSWTFEGKADVHDSGALDLKVRSITQAPRSADLVRRLLIGRELLLLDLPARVVDAGGLGVARGQLNDAIVRVKGTLLPAGQWRYDLDGEATPTVRVNHLVVLQLDVD